MAAGQFGRHIQIRLSLQHSLHVVVYQIHILRVIDGVKPHGAAAKLQEHHISQWAGPEASGYRQMKPPPESAPFPLLFEFFEGQGRKALLCTAATAPIAHKQMTVLNSDFFRDAICPGDSDQRALPVRITNSESGPKL